MTDKQFNEILARNTETARQMTLEVQRHCELNLKTAATVFLFTQRLLNDVYPRFLDFDNDHMDKLEARFDKLCNQGQLSAQERETAADICRSLVCETILTRYIDDPDFRSDFDKQDGGNFFDFLKKKYVADRDGKV